MIKYQFSFTFKYLLYQRCLQSRYSSLFQSVSAILSFQNHRSTTRNTGRRTRSAPSATKCYRTSTTCACIWRLTRGGGTRAARAGTCRGRATRCGNTLRTDTRGATSDRRDNRVTRFQAGVAFDRTLDAVSYAFHTRISNSYVYARTLFIFRVLGSTGCTRTVPSSEINPIC